MENPIIKWMRERQLRVIDVARIGETSVALVKLWRLGHAMPAPTYLERLRPYGINPKTFDADWYAWQEYETQKEIRRLVKDDAERFPGM